MVNQYKKVKDSCMLEVSSKEEGIFDLVSVTDPYDEPIQEDKDSCMLEVSSKEGICDLVSVTDPYDEQIQQGQVQLYVRGEL